MAARWAACWAACWAARGGRGWRRHRDGQGFHQPVGPIGGRCWAFTALRAWGMGSQDGLQGFPEMLQQMKNGPRTWVACGAPCLAPSAYALARSRAITSTPGWSRSHWATGAAVRFGQAGQWAGGVPGPRGSCHRCGLSAAPNHPRPRPGASGASGSGCRRSRRRSVFRLTRMSHA